MENIVTNIEFIFIIRILLATICGGIIGIERQFRTKSAGTRTHIMICIAACLLMIISKYGFNDVLGLEGVRWDVSRVAASIITGVGLLGGGLFFTGKQGYVSGITTAAGLLVTLGVGMGIGCGLYTVSIFTTIFVGLLQLLFHRNIWVVKQATRVGTVFKVNDINQGIEKLNDKLHRYGINLFEFKVEKKDNYYLLHAHIIIPSKYNKEQIITMLSTIEELVSFEIS